MRPTQAGRFELRRTLRIDRGRLGIDEGEYAQLVELRSDSTVIGSSKVVRLETVRGGHRFHYGDSFLGDVKICVSGRERGLTWLLG